MALLLKRPTPESPSPPRTDPPPPQATPPAPATHPTAVVAPPAAAPLAKDLDPRVARLRQCLLDTVAAVQAIDLPNFHAPDAADIASAAPAQLVSWAVQIARNLGCDGGASC